MACCGTVHGQIASGEILVVCTSPRVLTICLRAHLQRTFFPPTFHDMDVSQRLKPGDRRIWTAMKIFVELRESTTLNIPFREASKNWQWDGLADIPKSRIREHASLHVAAGDSSSVSFLIPMIIGPDGYESQLEVHLDTIEVTSSLNDIKVISAESCRVSWSSAYILGFSLTLHRFLQRFLPPSNGMRNVNGCSPSPCGSQSFFF